MIILYYKSPKKTYSQERADRQAAEKAIMEAKKEKLVPDRLTSLCCKSTIKTIYNPKAMENEVRTIRVCTNCNSEAPNLSMFPEWEWDSLPQLFIDIHKHKSLNHEPTRETTN